MGHCILKTRYFFKKRGVDNDKNIFNNSVKAQTVLSIMDTTGKDEKTLFVRHSISGSNRIQDATEV